jgi:L-asparaginase II
MLLAEIYRPDNYLESKNFGHLFYLQNDELFCTENLENKNINICLRSLAKPFQLLTCLNLGLELNNFKEIAICTASHSAWKEHIEILQTLLNRFKIDISDLQCGIHSPLDALNADKTADLILQNNCAGKHIAIIAVCKQQNWPLNYLEINHPFNLAVLNTFSNICQISSNQISLSLDGCGLPAYTIPVFNLLMGFSQFNLNSQNPSIKLITQAMLTESFFVSGSNRSDYELTQAFYPNIIVKSGAGGISIINWLTSESKTIQTILLKSYDSDPKIRALILKNFLLNFCNLPFESNNNIFEPFLFNLHNQKIAEIKIY